MYIFSSVQFISITPSCLTFCDPVDCSRPGVAYQQDLEGCRAASGQKGRKDQTLGGDQPYGILKLLGVVQAKPHSQGRYRHRKKSLKKFPKATSAPSHT